MGPKENLILLHVGVLVATLYNPCSAQFDQQSYELSAHNAYREKHDSPMMHLDKDMVYAAEACAVHYATLRKVDDSCQTLGTGENVWCMAGSPNREGAVNDALTVWYAENESYNYDHPERSTGRTDSFTQMVWKASDGLGIGYAVKSGYTCVVAKYKPAGNLMFPGGYLWKLYYENVKRPMTGICPPVEGKDFSTSNANGIKC